MQYVSLPVTPFQQNCSLLWCERTREAALIDPGGEVDRLVAAVQGQSLDLRKILLTHGHMDHVGGTSPLLERFDLPVIGPHEDDRFWIEALDQQAVMMGFAPAKTFEPTRWLHHGDHVEVGDVRLEVLHCPGHTPGHIVFFHRDSKTAFVGDVLFQGSIGRTDFPGGDFDQLISAIRTKLLPLGDDVRFVPGHGPESTLGHERLHNPFLRTAP